jgi:hypothetical protein
MCKHRRDFQHFSLLRPLAATVSMQLLLFYYVLSCSTLLYSLLQCQCNSCCSIMFYLVPLCYTHAATVSMQLTLLQCQCNSCCYSVYATHAAKKSHTCGSSRAVRSFSFNCTHMLVRNIYTQLRVDKHTRPQVHRLCGDLAYCGQLPPVQLRSSQRRQATHTKGL